MQTPLARKLELAWQLTKREINSRYKGSFGGLWWYIIQNLLMLALYSFVFGTIFKAKWAEMGKPEGNYTVALFIGMLLFNVIAETITRAPTVVLSNSNYVKRVVFPLEILSVVQVGAALFNATVATLVLLVVSFVLKSPVHLTAFWLPVIVLPLIILVLGLSWTFAAIGTYIRDLNQVVGLLATAIMFLSPLFYSMSALPKSLHTLILFNPLTIPMQEARGAIMLGEMPDFKLLGSYYLVAIVIAICGYALFQKARRGFADVL